MKPISLVLTCALLTAAGCAAFPASNNAPIPTGVSQAQVQDVILTGRAEFPEDGGFQIQAVAGDVGVRASVSLIEPGGAVRAGGVTDAFGGFTLYQSTERFVPSTNGVYTLEITKRAGAGAQLLALRTKLRWNGTAWQSISGPTILVNLLTTAVAEIEAKADDEILAPADVMGVAPGGVLSTAFGPAGRFDAAHVRGEMTALRARLAADVDPLDATPGLDYPCTMEINNPGDVETLRHVGRIRGSLIIRWNTAKQGPLTLSAPRLTTVDGHVVVIPFQFKPGKAAYQVADAAEADAGVASLEGFGSLRKIGGSLLILGSSDLESLKGLERLRNVGGSVILDSNRALTSLDGLAGLTAIGDGDLKRIQALPGMVCDGKSDELAMFIEKVMGRSRPGMLTIANHPALVDASAIAKVSQLNALYVQGNPKLTALPALTGLAEIFELQVTDNAALSVLPAWAALTRVGNVAVGGNRLLPQATVNELRVRLGLDETHCEGNLEGEDFPCDG